MERWKYTVNGWDLVGRFLFTSIVTKKTILKFSVNYNLHNLDLAVINVNELAVMFRVGCFLFTSIITKNNLKFSVN